MTSTKPKHVTVDLEPIGRRVKVDQNTTLLAATQRAGVELVSICGGIGSCLECKVRLVEGELSPISLVEADSLTDKELTAGFRLACQAHPRSNVRLDIPPESLTTPQRLQIEGVGVSVAIETDLSAVDIQLHQPTIQDLISDSDRVLDGLRIAGYPKQCIGLLVLQELSETMRNQDWQARIAMRNGELISILASHQTLLGLAVDVGTTKLAAYLINMENGEILARAGAMNPQIAYGEDVISRIAYTDQHSDGRRIMQSRLVESINLLVDELTRQVQVERKQIVEAVIVGNTAMHHLLAGLPVHQLGVSPYIPAHSLDLEFQAREISLRLAAGAWIYLPPNIAGYVGGDHVAMLLATNLIEKAAQHADKPVIALDIGTNTEISLAVQNKKGLQLLCCSCASGPAFEGAHIQDGMRAAPGAVERVRLFGSEVQLHTIGEVPPIGICGSGILDAVSEFVRAGIVTHRGSLKEGHPRIQRRDGRLEFVLAPAGSTGHGRDLTINRKDINEIQLAKAAIRAGTEILLNQAGYPASEIAEFLVAGAFGTYLDIESAIQIGMFPDIPRQVFKQVGNAAGAGARQMLVSTNQRKLAAIIAGQANYIELTNHPQFNNQFVISLGFSSLCA